MPGTFGVLRKRIQAIVPAGDAVGSQSDEMIRMRHYIVFLLLGIPTMVAFGIYNLWIGQYLLCLFIFSSAVGLSIGVYLLHRTDSYHLIYQFNILLFGGLLLYMVALGGDEGSKCLWMYVFPLVCFYLLGYTEGSLWTAGMLILTVGIFSLPLGVIRQHAYTDDFIIRFVLTYIIVSAATYWFEYFRQRYRNEMEARQQMLEAEKRRLNEEIEERCRAEKEKEAVIAQLQQALDEVHTLQGMVPICMHCKKIRDDVGYWQKIEQYIEDRTDARFSHGLCPECAKVLYPDIDLKT